MKGGESKLIAYMDGSMKRFIIPVYQRNYDWKIENCKRLYDDLTKVITHKRKSHFFGSIVYVDDTCGRNSDFLVIDGQQRLTTISLLFLAMYNLLEKGIVVSNDEFLSKRIYEDFLVDKYQPKETRIKLKSIKSDRKAFSVLFDEEEESILDSNITVNYKYFYERIQKHEISIDELFNAICSLEIIDIKLTQGDDPQLIFECLNSTGLDLSEGDKIRNFILMGLSVDKQEVYYEKYWNKIEKSTNYDVSSFIRDYLSIKQLSIPSQKKIYFNFKNYVEQNHFDTEDLLKDILFYAKNYKILLSGGTHDRVLNACIDRLNRLESTVTRPFFLEVLRLYNEKKLNDVQIREIFLITETYLFRRSICDLPTNSLNKIFLFLHREVVKYDQTEDEYVEKFKYSLLSKKDKARFPLNDEFSLHFTEKDIFSMKNKNKIYILERLENFGTDEDKDVYKHCDEGTYSIEHIMPQSLTPHWMQHLGPNYKDIHNVWLHRIANLTLTAYNQKYSNRPFDEKKNMEHGFKDSGIRMNTYIAQKDKWTLTEIEERSNYLKERALQIWKLPETLYEAPIKPFDCLTLDDDFGDFTGRTIIKFSFKDLEQNVSSWVDMYVAVLQILYADNKSIITKLAVSKDDNLASHFSLSESSFNKSVKINDNIFVWTNTNTQSKLNVLSKLFKLYELDPTDLVFYLREKNEDSNVADDD